MGKSRLSAENSLGWWEIFQSHQQLHDPWKAITMVPAEVLLVTWHHAVKLSQRPPQFQPQRQRHLHRCLYCKFLCRFQCCWTMEMMEELLGGLVFESVDALWMDMFICMSMPRTATTSTTTEGSQPTIISQSFCDWLITSRAGAIEENHRSHPAWGFQMQLLYLQYCTIMR